MMLALPKRHGSRVSHVETVVFETDRDNAPGVELSGITNVDVDWDIDRAGSKARIDIATHKRVLKDGMWVAPYLRITPEVGDIIYQQLGHYRLGLPSTIADGSVDEWGDDKVEQSATGGDIVDLLADASLPFTFYTPVGGNVMSDVYFLIKLATMGAMTPIPIANHSFEADPLWTGWSTGFTNGAGGAFNTTPGSPGIFVADGKVSLGMTFTTRPVGGYGFAWQIVNIPAGVTKLMLSGLHLPYNAAYRGTMTLLFRDANNNQIGSSHRARVDPGRAAQWYRALVVADVPDDAVTVRVYVESRIVSEGAPWARPMWDDIRLFSITGDPVPDSRINLPPSSATASTRIQTTGGNSIGYEAINADRLAAIGHHAIYTDLTGRLTSSPSRDLATATVSRTYGAEDYRLVGAYEVQRSANNRYNTVTAVKESFEEGVPPLFTTVWNDDRDDPWSVHHLGNVRYPNGPLMVQDAVDNDALESAALATLARATMQHTLRIQVMPDPTLTVHDVIEITGGPEEARGRWLIEYMRPGLSANDPIVEIGARRSLSSAGVSGVDMGGG